MSKPEIKENCFAFKNTGTDGCWALRSLECKKRVCPFFKTKEQIKAENERVEALGLKRGKVSALKEGDVDA
ncbi:MAG: hypothetical protein UGF89_06580 [Acutalibacteraceae bacterium]|nr:hypothetical protein [Acutalibacteraceae bacterium]